VRARLLGRVIRVTAASRGVTVDRMPARRGIAPLADIPDGQCRKGFPEPMIRREHAVVAMPMLPRRRDQIGEPVQLTFRRQCHPWPLPPWAVVAKAEVWLDRRAGILPANGESSTTPLVDFPRA